MNPLPALLLAACSLCTGAVEGQDRERSVAAAGEKWLASDQSDRDLLDDTVRVLLVEPEPGLAWLARQLPAARDEPALQRSKGVNELALRVTLEFLRRTYKSEMTFVGQYAALAKLQPFATDLLFELLLDTPDWYPFTFRVRLVPAMRDLQLRQPDNDRLDRIIALAGDDREPLDLRRALAAMLWQWGQKQFASKFLEELIAATADGDAEDRVLSTLHLADYQCQLRNYRASARAHRSAQVLAKGAGVPLQPISWYSAACVHSLLGDREAGMAALTRCAELLSSPHLDDSLRLERRLFENDPEIALLRADDRFAGLLKAAFGDRAEPGDRDPEDRGGR